MATKTRSISRTAKTLRLLWIGLLIGSLLTAGTAHAQDSDFEFFNAYGRQFKTRPLVAGLMLPIMVITTPFWLGGYLMGLAVGDGDSESDDYDDSEDEEEDDEDY